MFVKQFLDRTWRRSKIKCLLDFIFYALRHFENLKLLPEHLQQPRTIWFPQVWQNPYLLFG